MYFISRVVTFTGQTQQRALWCSLLSGDYGGPVKLASLPVKVWGGVQAVV